MTGGGRLIARIDLSWAELAQLASTLGPGGLTVAGPDGWALKDHLTHVAAWELWLAALLDRRDRLAAMGLPAGFQGSVDAINAEIWAQHRDKTADEAIAYSAEVHEQLMSVLGRFSDSELELPYGRYEPSATAGPEGERPVTEWVAANTYDHYAEHVGWIKSLVAEGS